MYTSSYVLLKKEYDNEWLPSVWVFQAGRKVKADVHPDPPYLSKIDDNIVKCGNLVRFDRRLSIHAVAQSVVIDEEQT